MNRLREAIRLYYVGGMTQAELYGIFSAVKTELGVPHNLIWTQYDQMLRTKGLSEGVDLGMAEGGEVGVTQQAAGPANVALERQTDPLTAYLSRLGIGSKQHYNPAESYQAGLFDPFLNLYQTQQRLSSPGGPLQNTSNQSATFSDFLNRVGTGIGGLEQGARSQLQDIFGGTGAQKQTLGYEPGQALPGSEREAGGQLDPGNLSELQQLLKYGLRSTAGTLGSRYAAGRLPQAQQAYYGQKAAGQLGGGQVGAGPDNFLDWLKQNWGLQF